MADALPRSSDTPVFAPDWRVHPGEILQETLDERGMTQTYLAFATGVTQKHINWICRGRAAITVMMALRLEEELDITAEFWLALQSAYDLHKAREERDGALR